MSDNSDPSGFFAYRFAVRFAALTRSTEAAVFTIDASKQGPGRATLLYHIRPDASDDQTRLAAAELFREIVLKCVDLGRGGPVQIEDDQWCLITLFPVDGVVCGAAAFITRSTDRTTVKRRMDLLNGTLMLDGNPPG